MAVEGPGGGGDSGLWERVGGPHPYCVSILLIKIVQRQGRGFWRACSFAGISQLSAGKPLVGALDTPESNI